MKTGGETTLAYVLRRVDYKESDRILTLFTRDRGKISALARGARKSNKRFSGALEPFLLLEVSVDDTKGGMGILSESSLVSGAPGLSRSLERLNAASFVVEMLRESIPEDAPEPQLFDMLRETLRRIEETDGEALRKTVVAFQLKLLALAGIAVTAANCAVCGTAVPAGKPVYFHPGRGGVVCTPCGGGPMLLSAAAVRAVRVLSERPIVDAPSVQLDDGDERSLEQALTAFIEHHAARPLITRTAFLSS